MKISLLTLTRDRSECFALAERWMARQTWQGWHQWVVADHGMRPAKCSMGQCHRHEQFRYPGDSEWIVTNDRWYDNRMDFKRKTGTSPLWMMSRNARQSFTSNMLAGLECITGDAVVIIEDDDWYPPDYLQRVVRLLGKHDLVGSNISRYYNLRRRGWSTRQYDDDRGAAMFQMAFSMKLRNSLHAACQKILKIGVAARADSIPGLEDSLWREECRRFNRCDLGAVGMKATPGAFGVSGRHRLPEDPEGWHADPNGAQLREWVGSEAQPYLEMMQR